MSACNVGDLGSIPGSGRSPGEGNGNPLHYSSALSLGYKRKEKTQEIHHYIVSWVSKFLGSLPSSFYVSKFSYVCLIYNVQCFY